MVFPAVHSPNTKTAPPPHISGAPLPVSQFHANHVRLHFVKMRFAPTKADSNGKNKCIYAYVCQYVCLCVCSVCVHICVGDPSSGFVWVCECK